MNIVAARTFAASILLCQFLPAQDPVVTATKQVENWETKGKKYELLRKINGRWWTEDNREVTPPGPGQVFWTPDSSPGNTEFFHHRPFKLARAESLHLFMGQKETEAALGQPNRTAGRGDVWHYYAADGTALTVRFSRDNELMDARYSRHGEKDWQVASITNDLGGRDIFKVMSERASQRTREELAQKMPQQTDVQRRNWQTRRSQPSVITLSPVPVAPADPVPEPTKRIIPAESYSAITLDATRDDLLLRLGEPNSRSAITDDQGKHESFTYDLDSGESVVIRLLNGKVVTLR